MAGHSHANESDFMARAIRLARKGQGYAEPNPMVGCVLVKHGRIISEGYHRRFGQAHAEVNALKQASSGGKGATAYVTLEPCSHFGKTPPCADALIEAGLSRVVVAMRDPFPEVAGRGIRRLRRAGIQVDVGLGQSEAKVLNAPYLSLLNKMRPYVILKWAQSIDGCIATHTGHSQWISGAASRRMVHRLRARMDGILVGINTALQDDPLLTARDAPTRRIATRIVLDTQLRIRLGCQLVESAKEVPLLVMTSKAALDRRAKAAALLERRGVELVPCSVGKNSISLKRALAILAKRRMTNILVEGGSAILGSFLDGGLADEAYAFVGPLLIGGTQAPKAYPGKGAARVDAGIAIKSTRISKIGPDILHHLRFV